MRISQFCDVDDGIILMSHCRELLLVTAGRICAWGICAWGICAWGTSDEAPVYGAALQP